MKGNVIGLIALLLVSMLSVMTNVSAAYDSLGVSIVDVKVNGDSLSSNQVTKTQFERDSELDVKVQLQTDASTSAEDVEVTVFLTGSKDKISETTKSFDVVPNTIYTKTVTLDVPQRMVDREYQLRVVIASPNSETLDFEYPLLIDAVENSIAIKEVTFSPNDKVMAGRALTATVRMKNYGMVDEDDVKVKVSIPELGVEEVDYINEVEKDETVSSEEMLLRIPATAKAGTYDVDVTVYYDDYDEDTKASYQITVVSNEAVQSVSQETSTGSQLSGKIVITLGPQAQTVARGESGVVYPLTISNGENTAKTFTLVASGTSDWGTIKMSPSNVIVLNPGETKQVYVYLAVAENAALGEHVFSVDVKSGNNVVQQVPLKADVLESSASSWDGVKKALQVGVIILVILILVLAVVIAYQKKFKGSDAKVVEDEQIAQTYY
ncbi:hypothetical protein JXB27_00645 [Candidatus Woesearchaeota archaeon]|nr:hypothetical protein [Candidatus Woesearchaeota archaeon]